MSSVAITFSSSFFASPSPPFLHLPFLFLVYRFLTTPSHLCSGFYSWRARITAIIEHDSPVLSVNGQRGWGGLAKRPRASNWRPYRRWTSNKKKNVQKLTMGWGASDQRVPHMPGTSVSHRSRQIFGWSWWYYWNCCYYFWSWWCYYWSWCHYVLASCLRFLLNTSLCPPPSLPLPSVSLVAESSLPHLPSIFHIRHISIIHLNCWNDATFFWVISL